MCLIGGKTLRINNSEEKCEFGDWTLKILQSTFKCFMQQPKQFFSSLVSFIVLYQIDVKIQDISYNNAIL